MSTMKRCISLLLALVMVLGMLPWDMLSAEATGLDEVIYVSEEPVNLTETESAVEVMASGDNVSVTRAQWLQMLVDVFDYRIEDEIVPDNYFTDLHEDAEYYEDILVAVYYGLVDVLPNSPMEPEAAATREFAVSTLNACMGYLPEGEPSFAEAAEVTYPDDIQVALEQGWFTLAGGAFLPQQPITTEEFARLQSAAEAYVEEFTIIPTESQYTFKAGVIEITEEADISSVDGAEIITVENLSKAIASGDKFVVYSCGMAIPYRAETVSMDGVNTVITATALEFDEAIETMIVQQEMDTDPANYYAAEDAELIFIEEESSQEYSQQAVVEQMAKGSMKVYIPKFSKKVNIGDGISFTLSVELKNAKVNCDTNIGLTSGDIALWLDTDVEVSGKITCDFSKFTSDDFEIYIGGYEVPGVGGLEISLKMDAKGSISVVKKFHMESGIRVSYDVKKLKYRKNYIFKLVDKGSTVNAEISAKICIEAKFGLYGKALPLKGYVTGEAGFKMKLKRTSYFEITGVCTQFSAHLYAEVGAKVEWQMPFFEDKYSLSYSYDVIDEASSPVKISFHYEDGIQVGQCTRKGLTGTTTGDSSAIGDSGYLTGSGSNYSGSGMSSGGSSQGYGSNGEPVIIYTYTLDEKENATITSYKGNATSLSIPLMLDGYNVIAIASNAFKNNTTLRTVIMQDNILTIGNNAFSECTNLRNLTLSEALTEIGYKAFSNTALTSLTLPSHLVSLGSEVLRGNTKVKELTIPKTVTNMNSYYDGALSGSSVEKLTFEEGMTAIPIYAAEGASMLTEVVIPESVTEIGYQAFSNTALTSLTLPSHLVSLGSEVLRGNTKVKELTIPKTVTNMNSYYDGALSGSSVEKLTFEEGMTAIPIYAAEGASMLTEIVIPESVTEIGYKAFSNTALTSLTLPSHLVSLGSEVLRGNTKVKELTIPKTVTNMNSYYDGALSGSSVEKLTFEEGMTAIPIYAAEGASMLTEVVIPESVTAIGNKAFAGTGFISFTIPSHIVSIGNNLFSGCAALKSVTWSEKLTSIPDGTFSGATALDTIVLPNNLLSIDKDAFENCDSLVTIDIPASVTTISAGAFSECDMLESIELPIALQKINSSTFYNCDALTSITIPYGVTSIGSSAFYDCDALTAIVIPYGVTSIGSSAFYDCDALETVDMANSVTSLGSSAFKHCDVLKNVKLSRNLTAIPSEAFRECAELEQIVIPYFATKIEANAFNSSPKLKKVVVHEKLANINTSAFSYADRTVFYGPTGSYTETWCADNDFSFEENTVATTKVTSAESSITIPKGKTYMLDFDIDPIDFHEVITNKSSNTAVATVDETGKITAVAPGTATIKINVGNASASCKVTVTQGVTKITLDKKTLSLDVPQTYQLTATITPADASNKTLNWTSSNPAAATVDANGLVTAVGNGTAVIKAESTDGTGISASCTVTVIDPSNIPVSSITLNQTSVTMEDMETFQLTAAITPTNAANNGLVWTSSDEAVATVDKNGLVTANAKGTATITATAADGNGATASCTVTVTNNGCLVTDLAQFQSSHPYENSSTDFWIYTKSGAVSLSIIFDANTEMEEGFDYLHIYDGNGKLIGTYTGTELAGQTVTIPGDTVKVQIESDDSGNAWGFRVAEITQSNNPFTDVSEKSFYYDPVMWAIENNITNGATATTFNPGGTCLRAHVVTFLHRAAGNPQPSSTNNPFTDVKTTHFFYQPVLWAVENGITNGVDATHFGSYTNCNRAAVVTFLWRAAGSPEPESTNNPFTDVRTKDFFYKPVLWAVENGITNGVDATHFGPGTDCNRAQVVTFLYRVYN